MTIRSNQEGSSSLIVIVLMAFGVSIVILKAESLKINMRSQEISKQRMSTSAQAMNLSAISYLHGTLDSEESASPMLSVVDNKIIGNGNSKLCVQNGEATLTDLDSTQLQDTSLNSFFGGSSNQATKDKTMKIKLQIIETKKTPDQYRYVVRATSNPSNSFFSTGQTVVTLGEIAIADKSAPKPPEATPEENAANGLPMDGFVYYISSEGISCKSTCISGGKIFDLPGTMHSVSSDKVCTKLLNAFGVIPTPLQYIPGSNGCKLWQGGRVREDSIDPNNGGGQRVCSCK